jgi:hypothetical protein
MRKLFLASALLLASASAHAGEQLKGLVLAAGDTPAATDVARPLPPVSAPEKPKEQTAAPARPLASKPSGRAQAEHYAERYEARRFEGNEAKARRIAARYGISW